MRQASQNCGLSYNNFLLTYSDVDKVIFFCSFGIILFAEKCIQISNFTTLRFKWRWKKTFFQDRDGRGVRVLREGSGYKIGWIFGKVPKGVGGVIFNSKIYIADFGSFEQGFLSIELIQTSNFRVQVCFFQQLYWEKSEWSLSLIIMCRHFILFSHPISSHICNHIWHKKICNIIFQKWGGGGQRPFGIFPKNNPIW